MRQTSCARNAYGYTELSTLLTSICVYIICARVVGCICEQDTRPCAREKGTLVLLLDPQVRSVLLKLLKTRTYTHAYRERERERAGLVSKVV